SLAVKFAADSCSRSHCPSCGAFCGFNSSGKSTARTFTTVLLRPPTSATRAKLCSEATVARLLALLPLSTSARSRWLSTRSTPRILATLFSVSCRVVRCQRKRPAFATLPLHRRLHGLAHISGAKPLLYLHLRPAKVSGDPLVTLYP